MSCVRRTTNQCNEYIAYKQEKLHETVATFGTFGTKRSARSRFYIAKMTHLTLSSPKFIIIIRLQSIWMTTTSTTTAFPRTNVAHTQLTLGIDQFVWAGACTGTKIRNSIHFVPIEWSTIDQRSKLNSAHSHISAQI